MAARGVVSGAVLQAARRSARLTQPDLSEVAGVSMDTVKRWENGHRPLGQVRAADLGSVQRQLRQHGAPARLVAVLHEAIEADEFIGRAIDGDCTLLSSEVMTRTKSSLVSWAVTGAPPAAAASAVSARQLLSPAARRSVFDAIRAAAERAELGEPGCLLRHQAYYLAAMDTSAEGTAWLADATRAEAGRIRLTGRWNPDWAVARSMAVAAACQGDQEPLRWFIVRHMEAEECQEANLCYWALWAGADPEPATSEEFMAERRMDIPKAADLIRHLTDQLTAELPYADISVASIQELLNRWPELLRYNPAATADLAARTSEMLDGPLDSGRRAALSRLYAAVHAA
jgi:transcriptional regulator with XRE-family HTH domain